MYEILKPFLKIEQIIVQKLMFILCTKFTITILLVFSILLSTKEYFGESIDCISGGGGAHIEREQKLFLDNYCWLTGTYSIKTFSDSDSSLKLLISRDYDYPYRGVGNNPKDGDLYYNENQKYTYHKYYQWIIVILIIQALLFYLPIYVWKIWERNYMEKLCFDLDTPLLPENWVLYKDRILKYFKSKHLRILHTNYTIRFMICEIFNFIVIVSNIFIIHFILPNFWIQYSYAIRALLDYDMEKWDLYSSAIFPKLTKCQFNDYGPSGSMQKKDALCLLPLNTLNEKIFAFLWIWLIFLLILSVLNIIFRILTICFPCLRSHLLYIITYPLQRKNIYIVVDELNFGNWFVLYCIGQNINSNVFRIIVDELAK